MIETMLGIIALATFVATFVGGSFAIRFRDKLHLILGFSAGAVIGVALFDLLPEAIELGSAHHSPTTIAFCVALGLFAYLVLDRLILLHTHEEDHEGHHEHHARGALGALTLAAHSFLDGIAIGVGFQAGTGIGLVVAAAVLTHDFSDGINTVNYVLKSGGDRRQARRWLFVDAIAPLIGIASTLLLPIPTTSLGLILAVFTGTFLYLGASDLVPESQHRHPQALTTFMTLLGALVIYVVVWLASL